MSEKKQGAHCMSARQDEESGCEDCAKVHNSLELTKDVCRVIEYFHYTTGSTLSCSIATAIKRSSVCWYVHELLKSHIIEYVGTYMDSTGRKTKHYSVNKHLWKEKNA